MSTTSIWPTTVALRRLAPGLLLLAVVLLLFRDTAAAMVAIWIRSDTFAHAFLVPPIVVWLVWRQRATLATLQPRAAPGLLLPIAAVCLLWLLGELAGLNAATQFALVTLLVLSVPAVFGWAVAHALLFPLLFLFFAVPFGEFMVPSLMAWTADFTVAAVQWSGVPVYREGLQFVISSGSWSVVEACSGVRYLIASFMVGTLFAYFTFRSLRKRALFIAVSLLVPIVANWFRAYLIVMLGHLSGNTLAAGVDHIIYGWVFFGIVIGAMFMIGARWADPEAPVPVRAAGAAAAATPDTAAWWVCGAMVLLLLGTQGAFWRLDRPHQRPAPALELPASWGGGWAASDAPVADWTPAFRNARVTATRSYRSGKAEVAVWMGYYRDQGYERKMVTSTNNMTDLVAEAAWSQLSNGQRSVPVGAAAVEVRTANLRASLTRGVQTAERLRAWQVYWIGGRFTINEPRARLQLALNRLLGRGDDAAVLFFYTRLAADQTEPAVENAEVDLARFVAASLPALATRLEAARGP